MFRIRRRALALAVVSALLASPVLAAEAGSASPDAHKGRTGHLLVIGVLSVSMSN